MGSFSDLLKSGGTFFKLYSLQYGGFSEFKHRFEVEFERHSRYGQELSVLLLKVNEYDSFLNLMGAEAMAKLMTDIELFVRKKLRTMDFCAIFMGRKIIVGLPETAPEKVDHLITRINEALETTEFHSQGKKVSISLRWSIASLKTMQAKNPEEIYRQVLTRLGGSYDTAA
jgi:diguanylate cyclase (GGDEF)-like protein